MKLCMTSVMTASQCILLKKAYALHVTLAKAAIVVKEETVAAQDPALATAATVHAKVAIVVKEETVMAQDPIPATVATVHAKAATAAKAVIPVRVVLQVRVVVLVGALMEHVSLLTALVVDVVTTK